MHEIGRISIVYLHYARAINSDFFCRSTRPIPTLTGLHWVSRPICIDKGYDLVVRPPDYPHIVITVVMGHNKMLRPTAAK